MNNLQTLRLKVGLTQVELAERTGIPQDQISRAEKDTKDLTGRRWVAIAKALGCSVEEIFE